MAVLTVIVPMYNVSRYLRPCLDSLVAQTLKDIKVILVDDGCTDETPKIAQSYVDQYPKLFTLIHKENGGLSDARNTALPLVQSEYVAFLDSDDWVEPGTYESMVRAMTSNTDVCVADIEFAYEDPSRCYVMHGLSDWNADSIQKKALLSPMFAWNKVYKAELFTREDGYRYPVHLWYEDIPVTTQIFAKAKDIGYVNRPLFHYRQREGSIMATTTDPRVEDIFMILSLVRENFDRQGLTVSYQKELEYLHIEHLRLYGMFRFIRSSYTKSLRQKAFDVTDSLYPKWRTNPYLSNLNSKNKLFLRCYNSITAPVFDKIIRK